MSGLPTQCRHTKNPCNNLLNFKQGITISGMQYSDNQFEVNPSGVVFVVGCHFPGMLPGLLGDDTSGVRNPNVIPVFL
jgi:hypothetical protein